MKGKGNDPGSWGCSSTAMYRVIIRHQARHGSLVHRILIYSKSISWLNTPSIITQRHGPVSPLTTYSERQSGANYEVDMSCTRQDASIVKFCHHAAPSGNRIKNIKIIYWPECLCIVRIGVNYGTINKGIPQAHSKCHTLHLTIIISANGANWIMMFNSWIKKSWWL